MDIRQVCFLTILTLISLSAGYLIFLTMTTDISMLFKLRFYNFIGQHVYSTAMMLKRKFFCVEEETWGGLAWMISFTGVNFLAFLAI